MTEGVKTGPKKPRPPRSARAKVPQVDGVLVLHKPSGPTSNDCLTAIKRATGQMKLGHAGTLDPLAEGVLVVLFGKATKIASFMSGRDKTYLGGLRLGLTTDTYDIQGQVVSEASPEAVAALDPQAVRAAVLSWGELTSQEVPAYSAAKHEGTPLYALARAGRDVPEKVKEISVSGIEVVSLDLPDVVFRVTCSAGTYVRSLVHSLGMRIGCGATMTSLVREASHPFTLAGAHALDEVTAAPETLSARLLPIAEALTDWPRAVLGKGEADKVKNGVRLPAGDTARPGARALFCEESGEALALAEAAQSPTGVVWTILRGLW